MTPRPIRLSNERVERFRQIYRQQFGEEIGYGQAEQQGSDLIIIIRALVERRARERSKDE